MDILPTEIIDKVNEFVYGVKHNHQRVMTEFKHSVAVSYWLAHYLHCARANLKPSTVLSYQSECDGEMEFPEELLCVIQRTSSKVRL